MTGGESRVTDIEVAEELQTASNWNVLFGHEEWFWLHVVAICTVEKTYIWITW